VVAVDFELVVLRTELAVKIAAIETLRTVKNALPLKTVSSAIGLPALWGRPLTRRIGNGTMRYN
jgi:hypothetical protein